MTAVLGNNCSPAPTNPQCTVSTSRHTRPPLLSTLWSRPVTPHRQNSSEHPEIIVSSHETTTLTCPTQHEKLRRRQLDTTVAGSRRRRRPTMPQPVRRLGRHPARPPGRGRSSRPGPRRVRRRPVSRSARAQGPQRAPPRCRSCGTSTRASEGPPPFERHPYPDPFGTPRRSRPSAPALCENNYT